MKTLAIISLLISLCFMQHDLIGQAQDFNPPKQNPKSKSSFKFDTDRLVFGGNLGASFGDITFVELAPTAGYLITDNYLVGLTAKYIYFEDKTFAPLFTYKTNIYGGGFFNQYVIMDMFVLHAEYELLNLDSQIRQKRINLSSVFVGGGYRSSLGGASFFNILLLYNLNDGIESPYPNPLLRVGFGIGLN